MAFPKFKNSAGKAKSLDHPWEAGDSIPAPDVVQKESDSAWAMWNEAQQQHERRFADTAPATTPPMAPEDIHWLPTQPAGMAPAPARAKAQPAQALFTLEAAMLVARRNNRVCPRPERWIEFSALLPPRKGLRGTQNPPAPATGAAWALTPPLTKRLCFREQIEWAERAGILEAVMSFMLSMPESDWLHMGED
ncbi:MAG TPA: hypothetical protein VHL79_21580 [Ramlibacter sp.]|jgi:hypothetical protein|nr:hypothetical protein [Ramlibacter sp.]